MQELKTTGAPKDGKGRTRRRRQRDDGTRIHILETRLAHHKVLRLVTAALFTVTNCVIISAVTINNKDLQGICTGVEALLGLLFLGLVAYDDNKEYDTMMNDIIEYWKVIATRDSLTGLYNRLAFLQALDQRIAIANTTRTRFGVMFIDLNKFKPINDTYGHAVGDNVLTIAARRLLGAVSADDIVARLGGDEFAILMMRTNVVLARKLELDILSAFRSPITINGQPLVISASIGTCLASDHHLTAEDMIHSADLIMYRQKALERWNGSHTRLNKAKVQGVNRSPRSTRW